MKYFTQYKGVWYRYYPENDSYPYKEGYWRLSDRQDDMGNVFTFNASFYRIDECLKRFLAERVELPDNYLVKS